MTVLFLPLAALVQDESTAKVCRQIPRLLGSELERALSTHGFVAKFLSSRGTAENGAFGLVATLEIPSPSELETTARMYGSDLIVTGKFGLSERNLLLEIRVFDTSRRQEVYAKHFETYPSYFFDTIEEVKVRITQILKIELAESERIALLRRSTESWQALLYYLLAEDDRYAYSLGIFGEQPLSTLDLYHEALTIDSDFDLARQGMQHTTLMLLEHSKLSIEQMLLVSEKYGKELGEEFAQLLM